MHVHVGVVGVAVGVGDKQGTLRREGGPEEDRWVFSEPADGSVLLALPGLLGEEDGLDVGEDAALGDGDALEELVQLLVVADGQLEVAGVDAGLLVVPGGVPRQLQHLRRQVLHDGRQVDGGAGPHALGVVPLAQVAVDASHGELQARAAGPALGLPLRLPSLSATRHDSRTDATTTTRCTNADALPRPHPVI